MNGLLLGAIVGFFVGWIIAAIRSRFTYLGGGQGMFEGPGCLVTLAIEVVCAAIGAGVGTLLTT